MMARYRWCLTVCCLMYVAIDMTETISVARPSGGRRGRHLTFPYGGDESYLEFIWGIGLPMDLPHPYAVLMSIEIRADYLYPTNASDFTRPYERSEAAEAAESPSGEVERSLRKREARGKTSRWMLYHILETATSSIGMDGHACMLRSICDAAATPLDHLGNGIAGQLIHLILTPSTTDEDRGRYLDQEYHAAERLGADADNDCRRLYPECDVSLLDVISTLQL